MRSVAFHFLSFKNCFERGFCDVDFKKDQSVRVPKAYLHIPAQWATDSGSMWATSERSDASYLGFVRVALLSQVRSFFPVRFTL